MTESTFARRTLLKASATVGGAALLAACTPKSPGGNPSGPATLNFTTNHSTTEEALFRTAADKFVASNPNINIQYLNIADLASYQTKMKTLAVANNLPDVFYTRTAEVSSQGKQGWNLDLTAYAGEHADVKDLWAAQRKQMTYEGKLLGLPYDFSNQGIYYNKTMFKAEGIDLPTGNDLTWKQLFDIAAALKR